ncbi:MAG: manganese efflux pump MntP family protein [Tissierellia bacterium]|nr:manganese efflux pump MntP family protein [Tissierellia bacterium]
MNTIEIFAVSLAVAMDAFAVSICKGLSIRKTNVTHMLKAGLYFGFFQALMPFLGFILGVRFKDLIMNVDHWIALVLLSLIGVNMIKESRSGSCSTDPSMGFKKMITLAIATSIDAMAVGITMSILNVNLIFAISMMGIVTFILSALGIKLGNIFGSRSKTTAEMIGGFVLIIIGVKILLEHLGILVL